METAPSATANAKRRTALLSEFSAPFASTGDPITPHGVCFVCLVGTPSAEHEVPASAGPEGPHAAVAKVDAQRLAH